MEEECPTEFDDLPNEMLEEIFNRIPDPNDFLAVLGTCRRWHDTMAYKKTERLFGKVFAILHTTHLHPHPSRLLVTRRVCRKWKEEVDRQLELEFGFHFELKYFFLTAEKMIRFSAHSDSLPRESNPILGRSLSVRIDFDRGVYELFLQTIQRHGHHLKRAKISLCNEDFTHNELVANLHHMPNVEMLDIKILLENGDFGVAPPPLPHLKILALRTFHGLFGADPALETRFQLVVSSFVAAYGIQLTSLTVPASLLRFEGIRDQLPNLTSLTIDYGDLTTEDLQVLAKAEWKLDALCMIYTHVIQTEIFVTVLNQFSATLASLELSIKIDESFDPRLLAIFSQLEVVSLKITTRLQSISEEFYSHLTHFATVAPNLVSLKLVLYLEWGALPEIKDLLSLDNLTNYFPKLTTFRFHRH